MNELLKYLKINGINKNLAEWAIQYFHKKAYAKGCTILEMGENTHKVSFIIKGVVRGYFINDNGQDITKCFSAEGSWCCIYNILQNTPSEYWIEALEDCILAEISVNDFRKLIDTELKFQALFANSCFDAFMNTDVKSVGFQKMQAKERYLFFLQMYPKIEKRVKQEHIASYIGITPSSLSRLKKSL